MKIVINRCYGGFGLSQEAAKLYALKTGKAWSDWGGKRNDVALVQTVEELGAKANGQSAKLKVVDIPDDVQWEIAEYDGLEQLEEVTGEQRVWF